MTVGRGVDWGRSAPLPTGAPIARSDSDVADLLPSAGGSGADPIEVGLLGGDLWRTLGGPPGGGAGRLHGPEAVRVGLDAVRATLDGTERWFAAHLVARSRGWRGRFLLAMNAEWLGSWKVAPKAHPGDGLLDVLDGALPLGQRLEARRRAPRGDHLPHPAIRTCRVRSLSMTFEPARRVWLDGRDVGRVRTLDLEVVAEAVAAYV